MAQQRLKPEATEVGVVLGLEEGRRLTPEEIDQSMRRRINEGLFPLSELSLPYNVMPSDLNMLLEGTGETSIPPPRSWERVQAKQFNETAKERLVNLRRLVRVLGRVSGDPPGAGPWIREDRFFDRAGEPISALEKLRTGSSEDVDQVFDAASRID